MNQELLYKVALTLLPGVGDITAKTLVSYCGSIADVFSASKLKLEKIPGIGPISAAEIINRKDEVLQDAEEELKFIERHKVKVLFYTDKDYPQRLKHCFDAPILLYYLGNADLNHQRIISIVGTRKATEYGKSVCEKLVETLQPFNALVVSGLAFGIDVLAHKKSLECKLPTVGVLAHGLDILYPAQHKNIAREMVFNGGLLTDFPSKTKFVPGNFPSRNRIVAGISEATIVIETKIKGGSVITAEIADSYNRDVFAIPGNIDKPYSQGCNYLIKSNKAALLHDVTELPFLLGWTDNSVKKPKQTELMLQLSETENIIYKLLSLSGSMRLDEIVMQLNLSSSVIAAGLLDLEFKGAVRSLPGKVFEAV